jgi:hypothetical protein
LLCTSALLAGLWLQLRVRRRLPRKRQLLRRLHRLLRLPLLRKPDCSFIPKNNKLRNSKPRTRTHVTVPPSSRLGLIRLRLLLRLRKRPRRKAGQQKAQLGEQQEEQPLERSLVTRGQEPQLAQQRVRFEAGASKRKPTRKPNNKRNNKDRLNSSNNWILFAGHFQPAWIPKDIPSSEVSV